MKALAAFGVAMFVAGIFIYPRPTLFVTIVLFVFTAFYVGGTDDD